MFLSIVKKFFLSLVILSFILPAFNVLAQTPNEERESLEQELKALEDEIAAIDKDIQKTDKEKKTLENQVYLLRNKIAKLDLQISQGNIMIKDLGVQVVQSEKSIEETSLQIKESRKYLAQNLQLIYEADSKSIIEVFLSEKKISDFFSDLVALESLISKNQEMLINIENLKRQLETEKESLDNEKQGLEGLIIIQSIQRKESSSIKKETDQLLKLTEAEYQKSLQEKQVTEKKAAEIRSRIFELIGIPEAPTFGEAYEIAKFVSNITNVRPALLLAVLTQESNIGKNVGQCYLKNTSTGSGINIKTGQVVANIMKPSRDIGPFLTITQELGRDPYNTPVSCPMSYGYGGAMGPAQFIPSTWIHYSDQVSSIIGSAADPWNIKDAFFAAALYLADYGATKQDSNSEWKAAMIYFSGTSKRTEYNGYGFYGDSVMKIVERYEEDIKNIE
ncbi:MAG: lytic murein transglycosylase [Patescibacteria group bacterium]|nr:lytic murein transglycosylase [Patescibacteria group bacterium]MBU1877087.1 lytic murein transglycosylase [Patescibacteria group bacterium]